MCAKYQRLTSDDYIRLGLCIPDNCQECATGQGHYVKNDKMVKNNLLLNNQVCDDKLSTTSQHQPLKKIVNNLSVSKNQDITCNKCKENQLTSKRDTQSCVNNNCSLAKKKSTPKGGFVNLAFVDQVTEQSSWYQPHLPRDLAVKILSECPVGSFVVRNSQSQMSSGCLALTVRVPRSFNGSGILHYLILVTEAGFRIKGFSKVFSSLSGLVVHHSVMKENLPCRLIVDDGAGDDTDGDSDKESDFADLDADPEYPGILSRLREQFNSE